MTKKKINGKAKGKNYELFIRNKLNPLIEPYGLKLERNLDQARDGGGDLKGIPTLSIECKNRAILALPAWWKQTINQTEEGQIPVLVYKHCRGVDKVMWETEGNILEWEDFKKTFIEHIEKTFSQKY